MSRLLECLVVVPITDMVAEVEVVGTTQEDEAGEHLAQCTEVRLSVACATIAEF